MSMHFSLLQKAVLENKLAHFLLVYGGGMQERHLAIMELAMMLNCKHEDTPCRKCPACLKILSGNHPDIHYVKAAKASVGIEQITTLQSKISRKIYEGPFRVCLIEDAETLTLPAANALLKMTEEPPENTIIVLSAANPEAILTTLRSRAQSVYFQPESGADHTGDMDLLSLSGADADLARKITETGIEQVQGWLNIYQEVMETQDFLILFKLFPLEKEEAVLFLQVLAEWSKHKAVQGHMSPGILKEISSAMEALRRQANHRLVLEVLALKAIKLGGIKIG